jgi:hypothetical protein
VVNSGQVKTYKMKEEVEKIRNSLLLHRKLNCGHVTHSIILFVYIFFLVCFAGWSQWSDYTACSIACGKGVQQRYRHCLNKNEKTHYSTKNYDNVYLEKFNASSSPYCEGYNIEQRDCNIFKCTGKYWCLCEYYIYI